MQRRLNKTQLWVGFLLLLPLMLGACNIPDDKTNSSPISTQASAPAPMVQKTHILIGNATVVGGDGEPIELINNHDATDPTYAELLTFIKRDRTDEYSYIFGPPKVAYICGDFAEDVHNNAEAAGIRAAWVGIDIAGKTDGHALNAFQTTDVGLVFIDCTGKGLWSDTTSGRANWDRRSYVEMGKPYAVTDIDQAYKGEIVFTASILAYLDASSKLAPGPEYSPRMLKIWDWASTHDVKVLGQAWMQTWLQEHGPELLLHGQASEPVETNSQGNSWLTFSKTRVTTTGSKTWKIKVDSLQIPQFQPRQNEIRDIDGMPISWQVGVSFSPGIAPLGIVKEINIHW